MEKPISIAIILTLLCLPLSVVFAQSSFTVYHNTPPTANGLDSALVGLIDAAITSVDVAFYSLEREAIVNALVAAKNRGVTVRAVAESDNYESAQYGPSFQTLEAAGIPIVLDTDGGAGSGSMHNKFFVFDGAKVWTGSYNPTNSSTVANSNNTVLIEDASFAQNYQTEFNEMFTSEHFGTQKSDNTTHSFTIDGYEVESHFSPSDGIEFQIQSEIEGAAHSVYFLVFSFTDTTLGDALIAKHNGGTIVQGAFDSSLRNQTGGEYIRLKNAGVPVKVDDYEGVLHHKLMIIDPGYANCAVITGSSNWSYSAFNRNDEDIVIIRHPDIVNQYYSLFLDIYENHCSDEGGEAEGAIAIGEVMSTGDKEDILVGDRSSWGESKAEGGTPGEEGEPDTLPPVIIHTPIERALYNSPLYVHCEIYDPNDPNMYSAKEPTLHYRKTGETEFQTTSLGALYDKYTGVVPASEVTTDGLEYYLSARDWSYNLATSPSFSPANHPYQVTVTENPNAVIRFTEIMYDPPGVLDDESIYEWVEIFNTSTISTVSLAGWKFTDGEGTYAFPSTAEIAPGEYQVLCKTSDGPSGSFTRYVYGPDSVGEITLLNSLGTVTDQLILKDENDLVVEEVDYSAEWGASNLEGPNEHTLERIDPEGDNDEDNWLYSMVEGGTPGAENSPHFIFHSYYTKVGTKTEEGIRIDPSLVNPGEDTCTVYYQLDRDCDVTLKVYGPPSPPEDYFSNLQRTLLDNVSQVADTPYEIVWDGKDTTGDPVYGICRVVLEATSGGVTCRADSNDDIPQTAYRQFEPEDIDLSNHIPVQVQFYQSKPMYVSVNILRNLDGLYEHMRTLIEDALLPGTPDTASVSSVVWDGRMDDGRFVEPLGVYLAKLSGDDIYGNVIISRRPLSIRVKTEPRSYFSPPDIQTIYYRLSAPAQVTLKIMDEEGTVVATPVDNESKDADTLYDAGWDGGGLDDGQYTFTIQAEADGRTATYSGKIALYSL